MQKKFFHLTVFTFFVALFILLCACNGTSEAVENSPLLVEPSGTDCTGFGDLKFGESASVLLDSGNYFEILQRAYPFSNYYCNAYYRFDMEGKLTSGYYAFNDNLTLSWSEAFDVYCALRDELIGMYGEPSTPGEGMLTVEDAASAGEGSCGEIWNAVESSTAPHGSVGISLLLQPSGAVSLSFTVI